MAAQLTYTPFDVPTGARFAVLTVVCDTAYPTGGYDISTVLPKGHRIVWAGAEPRNTATLVHAVVDKANRKLLLYEASGGASKPLQECAGNSVDVTASTIVDILLLVAS